MDLGHFFLGFLQSVALGAGAVFVLLLIVGFETPRRQATVAARRTLR